MNACKQFYDALNKQFHGTETVNVTCDEFTPGVLTLGGSTNRAGLAAAASEIASAIPGVTQVINNIKENEGA